MLCALGLLAHPARAVIVERVVAVIGERAILLSDLRKRARPFLLHIYATVPDATRRAAQESQMYHELLNKMIDERLEEQAADKAHVSVTGDDVDRGIRQQAERQNMSVRDLLAEAKRQGLSEQDYRDEIRRQLLQGKLIQLRVMPRVRVTEEDARAAYARWLRETGNDSVLELRILAMRTLPGASDAQLEAREELVKDIVNRARGGEDFCKLIAQYSDDQTSKGSCGSHGPQRLSSLLPVLQETVASMKDGETSDPITFGNEAHVIVQLVKGPHVPAYEEVKQAMREQAAGDVIERQRKNWLQELRRGIYIDVRL